MPDALLDPFSAPPVDGREADGPVVLSIRRVVVVTDDGGSLEESRGGGGETGAFFGSDRRCEHRPIRDMIVGDSPSDQRTFGVGLRHDCQH